MPRPRPLIQGEPEHTLAHRLSKRVDRLRQFSTRFGLRSMRVFLVWTQYDGAERGEGRETELMRIEILPTPKISELTSVTLNPYSAGMFPVGTLRVENVSAQFQRETLMGRLPPASPTERQAIEEPNDFFYEVVEDTRVSKAPLRAKYRLFGTPARKEGNVSWTLFLERTSEDRTTDEKSTHLDREEGD